ncbi:ribonuclease H-like domain-containing protein [Tanacetum coccineum]
MNDLFSSLGIIHQTSFAYSPHQNVVDERKHRHLLNVARSLLFQSGIHLKMWIECILTVVHLINKLPSSVLNGKSPFELVYGLKPILSHLRNFGWLCFSSVLNNSDKFSARDVKFYETVFPFKMNSTLQSVEENCDNNINNLNFFDEKHSDNQTSLSLNDDGRVNFTPNDEAIERYKARLVAKGFSQKEGFDYLETFSPVVKMSTVRCMLNVAICNNWDLFLLDINNAFLYGDLTEDQAPRQWNAKLTIALLENGFIQSKFDYSLFTKKIDKVFIALLVYVDDIVITGNDLSEIEKFKLFLKSKFQIKDLGKLKYFLGIKVLDKKDGICLSQRKYCLELLHEYGLLAAKHVDTPLPENTTLNHIKSDDDHLLDNIRNYQRLVGKLIYLTNTRPDISYDVHYLNQFMHAPLVSHLDAALRVLRYLKGSLGSATRKSVSSYCVFLGDSLVTWKSKKQSTLSRSYAEAEYRSMASATCEIIWLSNLLGDMGVKDLLLVVLYCDNSSALQIAANHVFHEKSKHSKINVHLVREKVASGVIKTEKIYTTQQIVDVRTKASDIEQQNIL